MSPAEARREACRILRDSQRSMARSVAEAERLLDLSDRDGEESEVAERRSIEHERLINPEFFVELAQ